jgi:hypothetical protein
MRLLPLASLTPAEPQANSGTKSLSEERTRRSPWPLCGLCAEILTRPVLTSWF